MKQILIVLVKGYKLFISPILPFNMCRYQPTCSSYAVEALEKHGAIKGTWLAVRRILSCHPYSKKDIFDPVP